MNIGISTNVTDILGRWKQRQASIEKEMRAAAREMAPVLQRASENILRKKVYSVAIPMRNGKPAWRRTGNLIASEKWSADGVDVIGTNTSDHAEFRLLLGTPYGRQIRSPGVQQIDWHVEAIKEKRGYILQVRAAAMRRAMNKR
jgi:hypothetical protein